MSDIKFNGVVYASSDSANITYKDTSVYNKLEELSAGGSIDGIIVNVEIGNWVAANDVWTNTIAVEGISASDVYDIGLYDDYSEEQANAYDFLITSIDTFDNQIVLTASEKIDVALSIILRGRVNLEDKNVFVSDLSATSIDYDNTKSGLDATNMQNAVDEIATMVNGLVVNVSADSWDLQEDGTYRKIISVEQLTGNETLDVCLYPGDTHTKEQIVAFSELISSIDTGEGMIILTAVEKITVSFRIFLYGKVNFDKNNLVALTDNYIDIVPISEEEFNRKSEAEKASGNYLVVDGEDDEFLSARNIEFDGSELGMSADNVQDAFAEVNANLINSKNEITVIDNGTYSYTGGKGTYAEVLIPFNIPFSTPPEVSARMYIKSVGIEYTQSHVIEEITCSGFRIRCTSTFSKAYDTFVEWNASGTQIVNSNLEEILNNPLTGFAEDHSHIYKAGNVKTLYLGSVINAMSYNTAYNAGTLPEKYRPIHDTVHFYQYSNGRYYNITINWTGEVLVTCTTNSLPSNGKPHIGTCVTYV